MKIIEKIFNCMLIIGLLLLLGRVITAICLFLDINFTTFFKDYSLISLLILVVGAIGTEIMKKKK